MGENLDNSRKMIIFQLESEEYAIPVEFVGSIEKPLPITRVPKTPPFVRGVLNLRGVIVPIIDLRTRFEMEETEIDESKRFIITRLENGTEVGFIVDAANDVIDIPQEIIEMPPEIIGTVEADYVEGVAKVENRLLILLDLQKILSPDDFEQTKEKEG